MNIKIEPDPAPRNTEWHRKIVSVRRISHTKMGNWLGLECGHRVQTFGDLSRAEGRVLCTQCRDLAELGV